MRLIHGGLFLLLTLLFAPITHAQSDTFQPILTYGRGIPNSVFWHPDGDQILVNSITGVWLYSGADLSDLAHFDDLQNAVFSPDGRWIAGTNSDGETRLYDSISYESVSLLSGFKDRNFSPDSRWLLGQIDAKPVLIDTTTFTPADLPAYYLDQPMPYFMWSPDSSRLLAYRREQNFSVWRIGDPTTQYTIEPTIDNYPQWSPDSRIISVNDRADNRVQLYDAATGNLLRELPPQDRQSDNLEWATDGATVWHPDSQRMFRFYPSYQTVSIELYTVTDGKLLAKWAARESFNIGYSPDGQHLALPNGLYDLNRYEKIADYQADFMLRWSPDNRWLLISNIGQSKFDLLDGLTGKPVRSMESDSPGDGIQFLHWSPDSSRLLSSDYSGELILWDVLTGQRIAQSEQHIKLSSYAAFSSDGMLFAAADSISKVRLFDLQTGELMHIITNHVGEVDTILWQPNGRLLATQNAYGDSTFWDGTDDRNLIYIWNGETGELVHTITGQTALKSATWSPDGKQFFYGSEDTNSVYIWDAANGSESVIEIEIGGWLPYPEISWSSDGQILTLEYSYGSHGGQLLRLYDTSTGDLLVDRIRFFHQNHYVWNWADGKLRIAILDCPPSSSVNCTATIRTLFDPTHAPAHIDMHVMEFPVDVVLGAYKNSPGLGWSPNGTLMAVTDKETTWIWEIDDSGKHLLLTIPDMSFISWSPDSSKIAALSVNQAGERLIEVFDIATGDRLLNLSNVTLTDWSPDSQYIFAATYDASTSIWDVNSGHQVASLGSLPLVWSPDSRHIADLSGGVIHVWSRD